MARKARPIKVRTVKRNPLARALGSGAFRPKVVPKPGLYKRRPKHRRTEAEDA